jgi:hypothetical protein
MRGTGFTALLAALLALVMASTALAGPLDDFRRNGTINPCRYSDRQLRDGLNGLPPDVQQYSPGLADQLSAGREGCGGSSPGSQDTRQLEAVAAPGSVGGSGGGGAKAKVPAPPAPKAVERLRLAGLEAPNVTTTTGSDAPAWLAPLLVIAGLLATLFALLRLRGTSPEGLTRPLRASFADAGGRTSDAFAQLWDTVRMGRG